MQPLYAIANDLAALLRDTDDELDGELESKLDALQLDLAEKVEGCCAAYRNLDAEAAALSAEANRFAKRAQTAGTARDCLKAYIKSQLDRLGIAKMDAGLFRVRIQANSQPAVKFDGDARLLPADLCEVSYAIDRAATVAAWRAGQVLPEGVCVERGSHLRIV